MTAHSYLFAADDAGMDLVRFIARAAEVTGFMQGAPGHPLPGWYRAGADNLALLRDFYARLAAQYPEAGQPFYAVRLWTNLMWQPAYLAAIGAHAHGAVPDLTTLSQAIKGVDVNGYRLLPGPTLQGELEERIARAGRDLRGLADTVLAEINTVTKLKRIPALRLLTDRMLGIMVRLDRFTPGLTNAEKRRICALWLDAMGLEGQGDLETIDLHDGRQVLIIARKGCCLDYLAFPDTYCVSCPKQDDALRLQRQTANAIAELDADEAG